MRQRLGWSTLKLIKYHFDEIISDGIFNDPFSFVNELKQIRVEPDPKLKIGSVAPSWLNGWSEFSV